MKRCKSEEPTVSCSHCKMLFENEQLRNKHFYENMSASKMYQDAQAKFNAKDIEITTLRKKNEVLEAQYAAIVLTQEEITKPPVHDITPKQHKKACEYCGVMFEGRILRKYCCHKHSRAASRKRERQQNQ